MEDKRHRIEYGELIRVQTFNRSYLQQPIGKKDSSDLLGPKVTDSTKMYFHMEYLSNEMTETANRLASLFPCLLNFYCFLQNWGILLQSSMLQKEDIAIYDYNKAIESERDLDIEAEDLYEALENLESFLKEKDSIPFKVKQNLLLEQKIIDIFLLIIELINTKIYGSRATKDYNEEEGKFSNIEGARTEEEWDLLEKTPQFLARKYLDKHVKHLYNILLLCTKGNVSISTVILKNSEFLTRQLGYYKKESGALLKEAIMNSAQLGDSDPHGEQIVKWVGLLEMIRESEGNLKLQILYLEMISLACLDTHQRGIHKYQNKVLQEFFSPNSHFLKGLVTFTKRDGKVYVSFAKKPEVSKEEFMESNYSLTPANEISPEEYEGKYFFSLQQLSLARTPGVELIIEYLSAVLWLFYSLCKNRNQDGINHIKGIGLQSDVLMSCMHDEYIHIKLKRGFIVLYEVLFIDVEPYKSIKDCSNHCYIWEEIEQKKLSDYTFMWHSLSNYNKVDWMKDYDKEKVKFINDFILNFWVSGKNIFKYQLLGIKTTFASNDQEYLEKAGLIHAMLKFTKNAVNLGFTNSSVNNQILYSIVNLFEAFNKKKSHHANKKVEPKENDYWVTRFVKSNGLSTRHELFNQVYLEALEIFQVMADLRLSLQVAGFLKVFKVCFENGIFLDRDSFNQIFSLFFQKYGLNIPVPKLVENSEKSLSEIEIQPLKISAFTELINNQLNDIVREVSNTEHDELIKSGLIFVNMLFEIDGKDKYLEMNTRKVLKSYFDQREALLKDLQRIEIISGKREIEIFSEFDSPERLEIQINKVLQDDENLRQNYKIDLVYNFIKIIFLTF